MGITKIMKQTMVPRQESLMTSTQQLNRYVISQFFVQLVNFQHLMKAMSDFVGEEKKIKSTTLFEGIDLCLSKTIEKMMDDRFDVEVQTERVRVCMENLGAQVDDIKIKSLYPRLLKLSFVMNKPNVSLLDGNLKKELEALFDESLKLNIRKVRQKKVRVEIKSTRNFKMEHGVAYVGKNNSKVTGDSYLCEDFQRATTMLAISDGMGNGEQAQAESSRALRVLKYLLSFDLDVCRAVGVLADLKQQTNTEERFFSLDLCLIDKEKHQACFYKYAATTTFVLRGKSVGRVEMSGLPIGALEGGKIDKIEIDLEPGDIIVMCSDGMVDVFPDVTLFEKRLIRNRELELGELSQDLLRYSIRRNRGVISDDMMVVAAKYLPIR